MPFPTIPFAVNAGFLAMNAAFFVAFPTHWWCAVGAGFHIGMLAAVLVYWRVYKH